MPVPTLVKSQKQDSIPDCGDIFFEVGLSLVMENTSVIWARTPSEDFACATKWRCRKVTRLWSNPSDTRYAAVAVSSWPLLFKIWTIRSCMWHWIQSKASGRNLKMSRPKYTRILLSCHRSIPLKMGLRFLWGTRNLLNSAGRRWWQIC